jgi:hypothetical protein
MPAWMMNMMMGLDGSYTLGSEPPMIPDCEGARASVSTGGAAELVDDMLASKR